MTLTRIAWFGIIGLLVGDLVAVYAAVVGSAEVMFAAMGLMVVGMLPACFVQIRRTLDRISPRGA